MGRRAAGITCVADTTGRIFLMRRSPLVTEPGYWSCPAGGIDRGEDPLEAAIRELAEESGFGGPLVIHAHYNTNRAFHHFLASVPSQFRPRLNWENDAAVWADIKSLPDPLHPGMKELLRCL
jgi:8-oxo-dGTP pyrophosphatase MutT (NUDIX family)